MVFDMQLVCLKTSPYLSFVEPQKNISECSLVITFQVSSNLQDTHQWFKSKFDRIHEGDNSR